MSLQQHHVEAVTVTLDYPSVSDFERDFLGLSSRSQWSSMLHRTRYHRSRFESRYQAYQPLLSPPFPILFCPHRFVAPATRGLRRCDRPFPESSSIIELDTEPHREASATFSTIFSYSSLLSLLGHFLSFIPCWLVFLCILDTKFCDFRSFFKIIFIYSFIHFLIFYSFYYLIYYSFTFSLLSFSFFVYLSEILYEMFALYLMFYISITNFFYL